MTVSVRFVSAAALLMLFASTAACEDEWSPPGAEEQAAVDRANRDIQQVYDALLARLDGEERQSMRDAQRAWIKWRDVEAVAIARMNGSVGGSALRVDVANAQLKLIRERIDTLRGYLRLGGDD
jgi:uncharacterized protein YecT (DUF1311 family)